MNPASVARRTLVAILAVAFVPAARSQNPQGYVKTPTLGVAQPVGLTPISERRRVGVTVASTATRAPAVDPQKAEWNKAREAMRAYFKRAFHGPKNLTLNLEPMAGAPPGEGRFRRIELGFENGKVDELEVRFAQFRLYGPRIDRAKLDASGELMFLESPHADVRFEIEEKALNALLTKKELETGMREARLEIGPDGLSLTGFYKTLFVENRVRVKGKLVLEANKINFQPDSLHVGVMPIPQTMANAMANRMNPLVDLDQLQDHLGLVLDVASVDLHGRSVIMTTRGALSWRPH